MIVTQTNIQKLEVQINKKLFEVKKILDKQRESEQEEQTIVTQIKSEKLEAQMNKKLLELKKLQYKHSEAEKKEERMLEKAKENTLKEYLKAIPENQRESLKKDLMNISFKEDFKESLMLLSGLISYVIENSFGSNPGYLDNFISDEKKVVLSFLPDEQTINMHNYYLNDNQDLIIALAEGYNTSEANVKMKLKEIKEWFERPILAEKLLEELEEKEDINNSVKI